MDKTDNFGLTRLAPGESLSEDGYSFQAVNPVIIDRLLKIGAQLHRHDAAAGLGDPGVEPTLAVVAGAIAADTTVSVVYTLRDERGGETLPSPVETIVTDPPLDDPASIPNIEIEYDAGGSLTIGTYIYAVAVEDGLGGVTLVGPAVSITRDPGYASAQVTLSGLSDIVDSVAGATGWRVYKSFNQGDLHYIADGTGDTLLDDGTLCANCTEHAPDVNTTGSTSGITVTVPASAELTASSGVRIYIGEDGDFTNPSFVEEITTAEALAGRTYTTLVVADGAPPDVSTCIAGASKIDPDTELLDWTWKRPVANVAALPVDADDGETRITLDTGMPYSYIDGSWQSWEDLIGGVGGGGGGHSVTDERVTYAPRSILQFIGFDVSDDAGNDTTTVTKRLPDEVYVEDVGVNVAIPDAGGGLTYTPLLEVAGSGNLGEDYKLQVELYITHTFIGDLDVVIHHPDGTEADLVTTTKTATRGENSYGSGWTSATKAVFSMDGLGTPFRAGNDKGVVGHFIPEESFNVFDGKPISQASGWKLGARDHAGGDTGSIISWALRFTRLDDAANDSPNIVVLRDSDRIENHRTSDELTVGNVFFRRGREQFDINRALNHAGFIYTSGNSTYPPPSTTAKNATFEADLSSIDDPLRFPATEYVDLILPITWTTLANIGVFKIGLEDEDGNFIYAKIERSSTSLLVTIENRTAYLTNSYTTAFASMVGKTAAWVRFVRWQSKYFIELWDVDPGSTEATINPLARNDKVFFPTGPQNGSSGTATGQLENSVFGPWGKETRLRFEHVPAATSDPQTVGPVYAKGMSCSRAKRELVAVVGDRYSSFADTRLEVLATADPSFECSVKAFDGGGGGFCRYTRTRDGLVNVSFPFAVADGTSRCNLIPPPPMFKPLRTDYTFWVPHSTGGTGETVTLDQYGNIVRNSPSPGSTKTLRGNITYPAIDAMNVA